MSAFAGSGHSLALAVVILCDHNAHIDLFMAKTDKARGWTRRGRAKGWALTLLVALSLAPPCPARAQDATALDALNKQVVQLYQAGKYDEAVAIARQSLTLGERLHGPDHPDVGTSLNNLALLYRAQGR